MSLRASARPGRAGANLTVGDFKHSRRLFAVRSREAPNVLWLELLAPSDPAVVNYCERDKTEYPDHRYLDPADTFDAFATDFKDKEGCARLPSPHLHVAGYYAIASIA